MKVWTMHCLVKDQTLIKILVKLKKLNNISNNLEQILMKVSKISMNSIYKFLILNRIS